MEKEKKQKGLRGFWQDEEGVGVIEIVLILVVLIGLVLVFKEQITAIINNAFSAISGSAGKIIQ
ncbi:MAG: hypothetical protein J6K15_07355 [Lachnospiraceae bacterium]|nr:hypothetical protein [Lachnospiraceae bacterium]MBP3577911.1 hypothetical protein [Lachnospiraceae bacterium]